MWLTNAGDISWTKAVGVAQPVFVRVSLPEEFGLPEQGQMAGLVEFTTRSLRGMACRHLVWGRLWQNGHVLAHLLFISQFPLQMVRRTRNAALSSQAVSDIPYCA